MDSAMSGALTILLLTVLGHDAGDPFTPAVTRATREALGPETEIVFRAMPYLPSDAEAASLAVELHADAVVELTWSVPDHLRANIHLRRTATGRWIDREIGFRTVDDPAERGRTVAFMVVSMLPERFRAPNATTTPRETPAAGERLLPLAPTTAGQSHVGSIGGMLIAALGVGDNGGGAGGALDFRVRLDPTFAIRFGGGARAGQDPPAQVVTRFYYGAAGIAWTAWTAQNARVALGLRWDALLIRTDFAHLSTSQTGTESDGKWIPGADLLFEAAYFITRGAAISAGVGAEATFGKTDILVGGRRINTIEPLRPLLELGIRAAF
jgi:hypothetical protein